MTAASGSQRTLAKPPNYSLFSLPGEDDRKLDNNILGTLGSHFNGILGTYLMKVGTPTHVG